MAACGDNLEPEVTHDGTVVVELQTSAPTQVAAGDTINVSCTLLENDLTTPVPNAEVRVVNEVSVIRMGSDIIAKKVGMVEVRCAMRDRGLVDPTPALVEILAGPAANVITTVTPNPVVAGNDITVTCKVFDAYGNLVEDAMPGLQLSPSDAANTVGDLSATMTRAGHYIARCQLPGTVTNNAGFDVIPNLPASLSIGRWPDLPVYAVGQAVEVNHTVADRYGNEIIPASVTKTIAPVVGTGPMFSLGPGSWRFDGEGRYRVTATVDPPTDNNVVLSAQTDIVVNSKGPAITCVGDATMLNRTPSGSMTVTGTANDVNGVSSLTVNGNTVTVNGNGTWSTSISGIRWGMNFVNVSATDSFGEPTTKVCTFLISDRYFNAANTINDTVTLKLTQDAIDDNNRNDGLDSLDDILYAVINSQGMSNTIHTALSANNGILKPHACDSQTCVFGVCVCWYSSGIQYIDRSLPGPNTVSLTLQSGGTSGGVRAQVRISNIGVYLHLWGRVSGIPYDTYGWVRVSYVDVGVTLDTAISNGQPNITIRPNSVTTSVGSVSTEFNGVDGWIINNIVVPLAQGYIRDTLETQIRNFITNNFNATLDGLIGSLDINTLGTTFNVPRIDGSGTVALNFGLAFSYLNSNTSRMLFGIGTRFTTPALNSFPTLGVALPPGTTNLLDGTVSFPSNTLVGAHVGIFNHALHALWRANFFAANIDASALSTSLPAGITLAINTRLPPVAIISGSTVYLHLGALDLTVQHPDLPPNLGVTLGADAHANVTLTGNDLSFSGVVIDTLHVSTDAINLAPADQQALQDTLRVLVQQLVDSSLNDALPAIPIPSFTIPSSLGTFGLPVNSKLGLRNPSLQVAPQHFQLRGQFGILP